MRRARGEQAAAARPPARSIPPYGLISGRGCAFRRCTRSITSRAAAAQGKPAVFLHGGPGRRHRSGHAPLLQSRPLPHRAVRSARLRCQPPARRAAREHHLGSGGGHRGTAPPSRHRALAGVRRLLGLDAGPGLCTEASRARQRAGVARHLPAAALRAGVVLPGSAWRGLGFSRSLGAVPGADTCSRTRRHDAGVLSAPDFRGCGHARRRSPRLVNLGRRYQLPAHQSASYVAKFDDPDYAAAFARIEAHYFVNGGFLEQRRSAAAGYRPHPPHPGGHRAGPLRHGVPDAQRLGSAPGLARGRAAHRCGRRPLGVRAGHRARTGRRHRPLRAPPGACQHDPAEAPRAATCRAGAERHR